MNVYGHEPYRSILNILNVDHVKKRNKFYNFTCTTARVSSSIITIATELRLLCGVTKSERTSISTFKVVKKYSQKSVYEIRKLKISIKTTV